MAGDEAKVVIVPDAQSAPVDQKGTAKRDKPCTSCSPIIVGAIAAMVIILMIGLIYLIVYGLKKPWQNT